MSKPKPNVQPYVISSDKSDLLKRMFKQITVIYAFLILSHYSSVQINFTVSVPTQFSHYIHKCKGIVLANPPNSLQLWET